MNVKFKFLVYLLWRKTSIVSELGEVNSDVVILVHITYEVVLINIVGS